MVRCSVVGVTEGAVQAGWDFGSGISLSRCGALVLFQSETIGVLATYTAHLGRSGTQIVKVNHIPDYFDVAPGMSDSLSVPSTESFGGSP